MRARCFVLMLGCMLLITAVSPAAATPRAAKALRSPTRIKVDTAAPLGHHVWIYAGRVACGGTLRLIGISSRDGKKKTLDWTLTSIPANVWALSGTRSGFKK